MASDQHAVKIEEKEETEITGNTSTFLRVNEATHPEAPEAVMHPLPDALVELIARRFRTLSEPTRIKLLDRLHDGEASVMELREQIGTSEQNISKHLGLLSREGIVARRKQGNFSYYSIADEGVFALCEKVCGSIRAQFEALREVVGSELR